MSKRISVRPGDVFEIALPDGRYAYGRVYKDAAVGIYSTITKGPGNPPIGSDDFLFHVGLYDDILTTGRWPIIGHDPFRSPDDAWPPAQYIRDPVSGEFRIYHRGEIESAANWNVEGLEQAAVWDASHVIERIVKHVTH